MKYVVIDAMKRAYGAGILFSSIYELRNANMTMNEKIKNGHLPTNFDYTMNSLSGLFTGAFTGLLWPITVFGRLIALPDISSENKNK